MNGFIAAPQPATTEPPPLIGNSGFWPDIDPAHLREAMRIDDTITAGRLLGAAVEAMASVNGELTAWRHRQQAAGHATAHDVPAEAIGGESIVLARYRRAVYCRAKAMLLERYRDFDTTGDGHQRADLMESPIDELRRDAAWAIADIQQRTRCTIELI